MRAGVRRQTDETCEQRNRCNNRGLSRWCRYIFEPSLEAAAHRDDPTFIRAAIYSRAALPSRTAGTCIYPVTQIREILVLKYG